MERCYVGTSKKVDLKYKNRNDERIKNYYIWSGRRDSNPRLQPWQGCALPLSYARSKPFLTHSTLSVTTVSQGEIKWQKILQEIEPLFDISEGTFRQIRLEKTWKRALERSEKAREAAQIRHEKKRNFKITSIADAVPKYY